MKFKIFSRKIICFQIFCGILYSVVANPLLIQNAYRSINNAQVVTYIHMVFMSALLLRATLRYSAVDLKIAIDNKYFEHNRNYFTILLVAAFESFFLSYLFIRFIEKQDISAFHYIVIPITILFITLQFFSFLIRRKKSFPKTTL